jgi:exodeoxyribonuclease-3
MRLVSWNVNGLRSVHSKKFLQWFKSENADVVCLQETKIQASIVDEDEALIHPEGFSSHWHFADRPGYSGVVIYSRHEPLNVRTGFGGDGHENEGRWLEADFKLSRFIPGATGEVTVISSYWPNSQRDHARLPFKLEFCLQAEMRLEQMRKQGKFVLICGDFNIAHQDIDLKNPKSNRMNAGFLPEERAWMEHFKSDLGWLDTFRMFEPGPGHYTWWSYRPGVREKNVGWRLDYFFANPEEKARIIQASHAPQVLGSDHCPVLLKIR